MYRSSNLSWLGNSKGWSYDPGHDKADRYLAPGYFDSIAHFADVGEMIEVNGHIGTIQSIDNEYNHVNVVWLTERQVQRRKAAELLLQRGLKKASMGKPGGPRCIAGYLLEVGGLEFADGQNGNTNTEQQAYLGAHAEDLQLDGYRHTSERPYWGIIGFSDCSKTTPEVAIAKLRSC